MGPSVLVELSIMDIDTRVVIFHGQMYTRIAIMVKVGVFSYLKTNVRLHNNLLYPEKLCKPWMPSLLDVEVWRTGVVFLRKACLASTMGRMWTRDGHARCKR